MITLYYAPGTCALAPHIVLKWLSADYQVIRVELGSKEYLKINPLGAVPAMVDGESPVMSQADALLKYLVNKYPDSGLGSNGDLMDKYQINHWLAFLTGDLHPAYFPYFRPGRYTTNEDKESLAAVKQAASARVAIMLKHLDTNLAGKSHLVGGRCTICDPYAFVLVRWTSDLKPYPNLQRFQALMLEDEGVRAAMLEEGLKI